MGERAGSYFGACMVDAFVATQLEEDGPGRRGAGRDAPRPSSVRSDVTVHAEEVVPVVSGLHLPEARVVGAVRRFEPLLVIVFRYVWPRAESAIYREAKRLAAMGLVEGRTEYTGKRARTVYVITEAGKDALRAWLGTPVSPFSMDFEAMLRIFVLPLGTKEDAVRTLEQVRADAREMLRFAGEVKQEFLDGINVTQDQVYIRALVVDFFVSLLTMVDGWAERSLAQIRSWDDVQPSPEKNAAGLARMKELPVEAPGGSSGRVAVPSTSQTRSR